MEQQHLFKKRHFEIVCPYVAYQLLVELCASPFWSVKTVAAMLSPQSYSASDIFV